MPTAKRAYDREDKEARRDTILLAAAELFAQGSGELPSVAAIADKARLAKGTVYLYFATRETIFATLLMDGWRDTLSLVEQAFAREVVPAKHAVDAFLAAYVAYLREHRDLLRLDALRPMLEQNLTAETLATSRQAFREWLAASGTVVDDKLGLPAGRGGAVLTRTHALTCGLWRQVDAQATAEDAPLTERSFSDDLAEALAEYWLGALTS